MLQSINAEVFSDLRQGLEQARRGTFSKGKERNALHIKQMHWTAQPVLSSESLTVENAAIAISSSRRVCAAEICVRIRARPCGTTG